MTGKWHVGVDPAQQECWPLQRGFDRYYGCLSGAINYFEPGDNRGITEGNDPVRTGADWYATDAFTDKAMLVRGGPREVVDELATRGHRDLYVDGGAVVRGFLEADLIDRLILTRIPILLGGGFPLFGELPAPLHWEHEETRQLPSGLVKSWYRRDRAR